MPISSGLHSEGEKGNAPPYAARLPDAYAKEETSTNARLLRLCQLLTEQARADVRLTLLATGLDEAFGATLDLYGEMMGQPRGAMDDSRYRYLLRSSIARNFATGDYESVLLGAMNMFGATGETLVMDDDLDEPGVVRLTKLPFAILSAAGFTASQAVQMLEQLLPLGVRLEADNFEGSFCFAKTENEKDAAAGFSDAAAREEQTMGGYLGFAIGEDESTPLPL